MLRAFVNAFKIPDLRKKILFTLLIIAVYRLGCHVPVPNIDGAKLQQSFANSGQSLLQFIDLFSGGALTKFAVFSLGIMPYITSSIIMQLLTVVIPRLEQWHKQGEIGTKKITQWTRYMTVALALLQSTGLVFLFHSDSFISGGVVRVFNPARVTLMVLVLTAGTAMIMWLGRADHPARDRQRHVADHLHQHHLAPAGPGPGAAPRGRHAEVRVLHAPRPRDRRRRRVHGAGPAADPRPVREARGGPPDDGWAEHLHPAEGEPGRRDPDHLRVLGAVLPRCCWAA